MPNRCKFQFKEIEMNCKKVVLACGVLLTALGASAQMLVPLLSGGVDGKPVAPQAAQPDAAKQLEALILCKAGTKFTLKTVESQFQALGLIKSTGGNFVPLRNGTTLSLFDDTVVAAAVTSWQFGRGAVVFLKNQSAKQTAKKLNATHIVEDDEMNGLVYQKETSKKPRFLLDLLIP
jgi:hypothetical protein